VPNSSPTVYMPVDTGVVQSKDFAQRRLLHLPPVRGVKLTAGSCGSPSRPGHFVLTASRIAHTRGRIRRPRVSWRRETRLPSEKALCEQFGGGRTSSGMTSAAWKIKD
jgi:hypothetical protein